MDNDNLKKSKLWFNVLYLGAKYEELSLIRGDKIHFCAEGFYDFAKKYDKKYNLFFDGSNLFVKNDKMEFLLNDYFNYKGLKKL